MYQYRLYRGSGLISRTYRLRGVSLISVPSWQCTSVGRLIISVVRLILAPLILVLLLLGPWLLAFLLHILLN